MDSVFKLASDSEQWELLASDSTKLTASERVPQAGTCLYVLFQVGLKGNRPENHNFLGRPVLDTGLWTFWKDHLSGIPRPSASRLEFFVSLSQHLLQTCLFPLLVLKGIYDYWKYVFLFSRLRQMEVAGLTLLPQHGTHLESLEEDNCDSKSLQLGPMLCGGRVIDLYALLPLRPAFYPGLLKLDFPVKICQLATPFNLRLFRNYPVFFIDSLQTTLKEHWWCSLLFESCLFFVNFLYTTLPSKSTYPNPPTL